MFFFLHRCLYRNLVKNPIWERKKKNISSDICTCVQTYRYWNFSFSSQFNWHLHCCLHAFLCCRIISGAELNAEHIDQLLSSSAWIAAFIIEILFVCYSCSMTNNEAEKIGRNLHNVAWQPKSVNCKIQVNMTKTRPVSL